MKDEMFVLLVVKYTIVTYTSVDCPNNMYYMSK